MKQDKGGELESGDKVTLEWREAVSDVGVDNGTAMSSSPFEASWDGFSDEDGVSGMDWDGEDRVEMLSASAMECAGWRGHIPKHLPPFPDVDVDVDANVSREEEKEDENAAKEARRDDGNGFPAMSAIRNDAVSEQVQPVAATPSWFTSSAWASESWCTMLASHPIDERLTLRKPAIDDIALPPIVDAFPRKSRYASKYFYPLFPSQETDPPPVTPPAPTPNLYLASPTAPTMASVAVMHASPFSMAPDPNTMLRFETPYRGERGDNGRLIVDMSVLGAGSARTLAKEVGIGRSGGGTKFKIKTTKLVDAMKGSSAAPRVKRPATSSVGGVSAMSGLFAGGAVPIKMEEFGLSPATASVVTSTVPSALGSPLGPLSPDASAVGGGKLKLKFKLGGGASSSHADQG